MKYFLTVLLFCTALAPLAEGQTVGRFANGWGTIIKRDSTFRVDLYPPTFKHIGDSLGYVTTQRLTDSLSLNVTRGATIKRDTASLAAIGDQIYPRGGAGGISSDSARRLGRQYDWTAWWSVAADVDTSAIRFFNGVASGASFTGPWSQSPLFQACAPLVIDRIVITHSYDSTAYRRGEDTLFVYTARDSIPTGASVYLYYSPSSDGTPRNATGRQVLGMEYKAMNDMSTSYIIGDPVAVPFIKLGNGIVASQRGVRSDHHIRATIQFIEKIPGLVY